MMTTPEEFNNQGEKFFKEGDYLNAELRIKEAIKGDPNNIVYRLNAAYIEYCFERYDIAEALFKSIYQENTNSHEACYSYGAFLLKLARAEEAKPLLIKAAALNSHIIKYWSKLAEVQFILGDKQGLEDSIKHILRLNPSDASHWRTLGILLYEQHKFSDAEAAWIRAVKLNPLDSNTWFNLSSAKIMLNKFSQAELCAQKSIRLNSDDEIAWENLATSLFEQNKLAEELLVLKKIIMMNPEVRKSWETFYSRCGEDDPGVSETIVQIIKSCKAFDSFCRGCLEEAIRTYHDSDKAESRFHAEVIYAVLEKYHADKVPISEMQRYARMLDAPSRNKGAEDEDFDAIKHYYLESFKAGYPVCDMYVDLESVVARKKSYSRMTSLVVLSYKALIDHSQAVPDDSTEFELAKNQAIETLSSLKFK